LVRATLLAGGVLLGIAVTSAPAHADIGLKINPGHAVSHVTRTANHHVQTDPGHNPRKAVPTAARNPIRGASRAVSPAQVNRTIGTAVPVGRTVQSVAGHKIIETTTPIKIVLKPLKTLAPKVISVVDQTTTVIDRPNPAGPPSISRNAIPRIASVTEELAAPSLVGEPEVVRFAPGVDYGAVRLFAAALIDVLAFQAHPTAVGTAIGAILVTGLAAAATGSATAGASGGAGLALVTVDPSIVSATPTQRHHARQPAVWRMLKLPGFSPA